MNEYLEIQNIELPTSYIVTAFASWFALWLETCKILDDGWEVSVHFIKVAGMTNNYTISSWLNNSFNFEKSIHSRELLYVDLLNL